MSVSSGRTGLPVALVVSNAVIMAGVVASHADDWSHSNRRWALICFGLAALVAATGVIVGSRRVTPSPGTLAASATEAPGDLKGIELATTVISIAVSVVGAILSAVGLG